ncbi:MAG: L-serine ammonia-lyase [Bacteroidetes bacterium]|nr:L-serine ammonia-lyase [Bacteroidota bacterium]
MNYISVFDMLKICVGPSSSHTLGPWKAALHFVKTLQKEQSLNKVNKVIVELYGSLALTGKGHGTDIAILMGLNHQVPETCDTQLMYSLPEKVAEDKALLLGNIHSIDFDVTQHIQFHTDQRLPFHTNGMIFKAFDVDNHILHQETYYSIGGGFISVGETADEETVKSMPKHYCYTSKELIKTCQQHQLSIAALVMQNEESWRSPEEIDRQLSKLIIAMQESVYKGCHQEGELPGGLNVKRRAAAINKKMLGELEYNGYGEWLQHISKKTCDFSAINKWISAFAMAVNEENAAFGRIVTAPTNGSAGVIPAVMHYLMCFAKPDYTQQDLINFLLVASEIGNYFKTHATISAAAGGCQAEIGVSSAMAAAALTESMGGTVEQSLVAAEIAMEHHLGLTCDPIKGLVQVPCIERNSMGAIKAILASNLALETDPSQTKVSLDEVINTMWSTAKDMHEKYKETSIGGLAVNVGLPEC